MSFLAVVSIAGPTGTGKTAAALALAGKLPVTVINFDSRQVYEDFPIITAQPTPEEMRVCPHELYGFLGTREKVTAGSFVQKAKDEIDRALESSRLPVLVGGTGLYLRSLTRGIAPIPDIPEDVHQKSLDHVRDRGVMACHELLKESDPEYAAKIHHNDKQRVSRALEVFWATGKPISWWHRQKHSEFKYPVINILLSTPLDELGYRLKSRILLMLEAGAEAEARKAYEKCSDPDAPGWSGIGCAEMFGYITGQTDMDEARRLWFKNTRAYAKRQITWFNKEHGMKVFGLNMEKDIVDYVSACLE